jgi:hypothetical protein
LLAGLLRGEIFLHKNIVAKNGCEIFFEKRFAEREKLPYVCSPFTNGRGATRCRKSKKGTLKSKNNLAESAKMSK